MSGSTINGICKSKSIIAQKVIRLCDIDQISHFKSKIPNLKVIFLYRDPRGIFSSRQKLIGESLAFKTVEKTCDMYSKSLAKSNGNDFLSIRYEDISLDPMAAAEKIYDFVNEELPRLEFNFIMTQSAVFIRQSAVFERKRSKIRSTLRIFSFSSFLIKILNYFEFQFGKKLDQ